MTNPTPQQRKALGITFMGVGVTFIALGFQQPAFLGVGIAMLSVGLVYLANARKGDGA